MRQAVEAEKEDVIPSVDTLADIFMDMLGEDKAEGSLIRGIMNIVADADSGKLSF